MTTKIIRPAPPLINALRSQLPQAPYLGDFLNQFSDLVNLNIDQINAQLAGNPVTLLGLTSAVNGTIVTTNNNGLYLISVQHETQVVGTAGKLNTKISWKDDATFRTRVIATDVDLSTLDEEDGLCIVRVIGNTPITYQTTLTGATGSPSYNLFLYVKELT